MVTWARGAVAPAQTLLVMMTGMPAAAPVAPRLNANHVVVVAVCEPVHSTGAPVARRAAAAQVVVAVAACRPAGEQPPRPRTPRSGTAAASPRYPRDMLAHNTCAALAVAACTPARSIPAVEAVVAPADAARSAPLARELLVAHIGAAARAPPLHSGAPAAGMPRTDPAAARAAAG